MRISVVIPTLDEELAIGKTLRALQHIPEVSEIFVVDGGSQDATCRISEQAGARVLRSAAGRGPQLHHGAGAASGEVFWFLHADTVPPPNAGAAIVAALSDPAVAAGNFALRFDGSGSGARRLTRIYPRLRKLGLCYGDSGIFVRREAYRNVGGFPPHPLFEDLGLLRRLRPQGRFVHLECTLVASSRRFEHRNFSGMFAYWSALQVLYWAGVPPAKLAGWYRPVRATAPAHASRCPPVSS